MVAAKRYLYHAGYYILNSSAIKLCDAWQAPLSLPLALSSHKRGMLAPLPSREGPNHFTTSFMIYIDNAHCTYTFSVEIILSICLFESNAIRLGLGNTDTCSIIHSLHERIIITVKCIYNYRHRSDILRKT